ncbi:MAG: cytochrome d ubiquinol oxidase subunit II [Steroidobacteraceae bacterium]|nr:cytochrome d ubiquinol oxidase subunit II [Steroidobacteraceae bacterium]
MSAEEVLTGSAYWLPLVCAAIVALGVVLYVVLDGFDLGIGILFPFFPRESDRDRMMNSVAPFWDGNETWLVLGGNGLFVAFPLAYAIIMPALYVPLITMLLALVFRGVAFEFRWVAKPHHRKWDIAFAAGSIVAGFCQGLMLGGLLDGIEHEQRQFAGGAFDFLTPFSVICGVGLVVGYALLGATWLVMKTTHELEEQARRYGMPLLIGLLAMIVLVSVWTPIQYPDVAERWFSWPNVVYLSPVPIVTAVLGWICWRGLRGAHTQRAFYSAVALFVISFIGLVISLYPYMVPRSVTLWDASASVQSQVFLLVGVLILLPLIIGYTVFVYHTFRGKLREGEGYH